MITIYNFKKMKTVFIKNAKLGCFGLGTGQKEDLEKLLPNFSKSCPKSCQAKKGQNICMSQPGVLLSASMPSSSLAACPHPYCLPFFAFVPEFVPACLPACLPTNQLAHTISKLSLPSSQSVFIVTTKAFLQTG
jgi:hypothetical protein